MWCDLLLSKLRNKSCLSPVKALGEILSMRFRERSKTLRAIKGLKALGGSIVNALRGRSRSDRFLMPVNISGLSMLIWFCPSMRKRRFRRSYRHERTTVFVVRLLISNVITVLSKLDYFQMSLPGIPLVEGW